MRTVDLTAKMDTQSLLVSDAVFPVELRPAAYSNPDPEDPRRYDAIPSRWAVVRPDTGRCIGLVSHRYTLVPHGEILAAIESGLERLGFAEAPRQVHMDRDGARMRALFKIDRLHFDVGNGDILCPMIRVTNSYDKDERFEVELGAFRFVCTNLMIGGPGFFAAGFRSIHVGRIDLQEIASHLTETLERFPRMGHVFAEWRKLPWVAEELHHVSKDLQPLRPLHRNRLQDGWNSSKVRTVWDAYNVATDYATHGTRTVNVAYGVLAAVNCAFSRFGNLN